MTKKKPGPKGPGGPTPDDIARMIGALDSGADLTPAIRAEIRAELIRLHTGRPRKPEIWRALLIADLLRGTFDIGLEKAVEAALDPASELEAANIVRTYSEWKKKRPEILIPNFSFDWLDQAEARLLALYPETKERK